MLLDSKMTEMEPVLMFMKHVLMVTRMMELDNVSSNLQVVEITLLMTEMEIVLLSSNNTLLSSSCMTHQENPPDVTQLAQNVNLKDNVLPVKSVIPLIQLPNNAFFVMDVFHVMVQIQLNVPDVSTLKFTTELERPVLILLAQSMDVFNAIWTQLVKFANLDIL